MKNTLEVDSVLLEFGKNRVLYDVFLHSATGTISGLLGRNGSGKTCLMNIIYGELKTNHKSVRVNGKVLQDGNRKIEMLRYLPQFSFIPKNFKVKRIFKDFELSFSDFTEYFPEFKKYYNERLKELSGGESRIIEIYSILASKTKFVMLDEPFSQVMPVHLDTIKRIMKDEKSNKGIIITDHLYEHIIDVCDDIYVIAFGKTIRIHCEEDLVKLGYLSQKKL